MDDYMFVALCPCGRRTLATKGSPALCVACMQKLFTETREPHVANCPEPGTATASTAPSSDEGD
jgi:hypothetical protein